MSGGLSGNAKFKWNSQSASAIFMILVLSGMYYHFMHNLHLNEISAHPMVILAMPPLTIIWGLSIFPLMMFLSLQDDFKNVNPLVPSNYRDIVLKAYKTMSENGGRVREKDM